MNEDETQHLENQIEDLHEDMRAKHHEDRSIVTWLWRGILFGIGSTLGVALLFYLFLLVARGLINVPILGDALHSFEPLLKQTAETRVPNVENLIPAVPNAPKITEAAKESSTDSKTDQTTSTEPVEIKTIAFSLTAPSGWTHDQQTQAGQTPFVAGATAKSPDAKIITDSAGFNTEFQGAQLTVIVTPGPVTSSPDEGVISQRTQKIAGETATYTVSKPKHLTTGEVIDVQIDHKGQHYDLEFAYNPSSSPTGQSIFDDILKSFAFAD